MKKLLTLIPLMLLILLTACNENAAPEVTETETVSAAPVPTPVPTPRPTPTPTPAPEYTMSAKVLYDGGSFILTASLTTEDFYAHNIRDVEIVAEDGTAIESSDLTYGTEIQIFYNGTIADEKSSPSTVTEMTKIVISGRSYDFTGFYKQVTDMIYSEDRAMNEGISVIALDLSGEVNMLPSEKRGLIYLLGLNYSETVIAGTYDSLVEDGYIDDEAMRFEDGILIEITSKPLIGNTLSFDVTKWREGLLSMAKTGCIATYTDGAWIIE